MWAALKLISPLHYFYGVLLAALLVFGVYEREHLIGAGEAKIEKKDTALRQAAMALNVAAENLAEVKEISIGRTYEKIILQPVPAASGLVCHNFAAVEPKGAPSGPKDISPAEQLPGGGFNPSSGLLTLLRNDDAQIDALIDTVLNLENELVGKTE